MLPQVRCQGDGRFQEQVGCEMLLKTPHTPSSLGIHKALMFMQGAINAPFHASKAGKMYKDLFLPPPPHPLQALTSYQSPTEAMFSLSRGTVADQKRLPGGGQY